ncbi:hypothetical protein M5K25_021031 [Dendrobium thyrsiflorum]|uniref:Uncharacterized protein n=1 Tax=Dendrobium thyrsiflorum TaxID=117978 RepID=A0ABD0UIS4_DENTH
MAGRKVEVLEGELGPLKADFEKIADFQNQIVSVNEKIEGRFAVLEDMLKKFLEAKSNPAKTSEAKETTVGHRRGENPNPFRRRKNPNVEILEGEDDMPLLESLSREERSIGFERMVAAFSGKREGFNHKGAKFERGRGGSE